MSNEEVRLKIKIDAKSQELILMNQQVKDLGKSFTDTDSFANTFLSSTISTFEEKSKASSIKFNEKAIRSRYK